MGPRLPAPHGRRLIQPLFGYPKRGFQGTQTVAPSARVIAHAIAFFVAVEHPCVASFKPLDSSKQGSAGRLRGVKRANVSVRRAIAECDFAQPIVIRSNVAIRRLRGPVNG